jgi:[acyl-carrier-protein] S-malonyltransferase
MGGALASAFAEAARTFEEADEILGFRLSRLAWEGPAEELTQTRNAQPAILAHSVAVWRVLADAIRGASLAAGHSLGEFSAYVCTGTLSFESALRAVRLRGELMYSAGQTRPGTMAAVLGLEDDRVRELCAAASSVDGLCVPANFNSPGQVVISGDPVAVDRAVRMASDAGAKKAVTLNVSGAFHSPLMGPASEGLREALEGLDFRDPRFPVVANVTASAVRSGAEARRLLVRQLTSPVRWSESVRAMSAAGVDRFVELGPGGVLSGLNRRNARGVASVSVGDPAEVEAFTAS